MMMAQLKWLLQPPGFNRIRRLQINKLVKSMSNNKKWFFAVVIIILFASCSKSTSTTSTTPPPKDSTNHDSDYLASWIYFDTAHQNPFVTSMYTADPSAHVWADGRLYVYPSHDIPPAHGCNWMDQYHVFSTDDLVH